MSKASEYATAITFLKDRLNIDVTDAVVAAIRAGGQQTEITRLKSVIENAIEVSINSSHNAFASLMK